MIIEEFEVMEDISSELTRTEYLLLGPMCWISHFGPNGHEKRVISLIRVIVCVSPVFTDRAELFPPWAFVESRLWGPLEQYKCWVYYCWATDGQNVSVCENCHRLTADFF